MRCSHHQRHCARAIKGVAGSVTSLLCKNTQPACSSVASVAAASAAAAAAADINRIRTADAASLLLPPSPCQSVKLCLHLLLLLLLLLRLLLTLKLQSLLALPPGCCCWSCRPLQTTAHLHNCTAGCCRSVAPHTAAAAAAAADNATAHLLGCTSGCCRRASSCSCHWRGPPCPDITAHLLQLLPCSWHVLQLLLKLSAGATAAAAELLLLHVHARPYAPARMHFWLLQALFILPMSLAGSTVPRNTGLNWFMPALVNSSVGSFSGTCSKAREASTTCHWLECSELFSCLHW